MKTLLQRTRATARLLTVATAGVLMVAHPAHAADDAELKEGIAKYERGEFDDALRVFRVIAGRPGNSAVRAQAYLYVGLSLASRGGAESSDARYNFRRALEIDATVTLDPARFSPTLVESFEETRRGVRGMLLVECDRVNAVVEVAGEPKTRCGFPIRVRVGKHRVFVVADFVPKHAETIVRANVTTTVRIAFGPEPSPTASRGVGATPSTSNAAAISSRPESTGKSVKEIIGIALVTVAGASALAGTVLGILANEARSDFENQKGAGTLSVSDALNLEAKTSARATAANVLFVSAGVTAVGGVVLLVLGKPAAPKRSAGGFQGVEVGGAALSSAGGGTFVVGRWAF